jgi:AAHS family benzoate transporter-like MFS transporter
MPTPYYDYMSICSYLHYTEPSKKRKRYFAISCPIHRGERKDKGLLIDSVMLQPAAPNRSVQNSWCQVGAHRRMVDNDEGQLERNRPMRLNANNTCYTILTFPDRFTLSHRLMTRNRRSIMTSRRKETDWALVIVVALIMLCEGFDLMVYSSVIPVLIEDVALSIDRAAAGYIGSATFLGMFLGGMVAGRVYVRFGYTKTIGLGIAWFSLAMVLAATAQGGLLLGAARALAGLGLGVVLPAALALARQHSSQRQAAMVISVAMAGIPFGGLLAVWAASMALPHMEWRTMMLAAAALGLLPAVALFLYLTKPTSTVEHDSQPDSHNDHRTPNWKQLLILTLASFAFLMAFYGISTWLAQLMREFNLPMQDSLQLTITLNLGSALGSLFTAWAATKVSVRAVALGSALLAVICLVGIALRPTNQPLLFCLVLFAGIGAISTQNLTNTLVSNTFPASERAAALGITLGIGRLGAVISPSVGGLMLQAELGAEAVLVFLASAELFGAVLLLTLHRSPGVDRNNTLTIGAKLPHQSREGSSVLRE